MSSKNSKSQKLDHSIWILSSGLPDNVSIEEHLLKLGLYIENKKSELMKLKEKCQMDIFCGLSLKGTQGSFSLSAEIIGKLSSIPIETDVAATWA